MQHKGVKTEERLVGDDIAIRPVPLYSGAFYRRVVWFILVAVPASILMTACPEQPAITFANESSSRVVVVLHGECFVIDADSERRIGFTKASFPLEITVITEDGAVLSHEVLSLDELDEQDRRVVIEEGVREQPSLSHYNPFGGPCPEEVIHD